MAQKISEMNPLPNPLDGTEEVEASQSDGGGGFVSGSLDLITHRDWVKATIGLDYGDFAGAEGIHLIDVSGRAIEIENTDTTSIQNTLRNTNGGVRLILGSTAPFFFQQTDASGAFEQAWIRCNRNAGIDFFYADTLRLATTSTGASVEGTTLEVNSVEYTWPGANDSGVLTNDGTGDLTWGNAGQVDSYTTATLPSAAANTGLIAFDTDVSKHVGSDGSAWNAMY